MTSLVHDVSDNHGADERQKQLRQGEPEDQQETSATSTGSQTMVATPPTDYATPYAHLDMAHAMQGQIAYPNIDPYYGSLYAAYGGQPMMHPPLVGMHPAGLPLPTDAIEEPVYVNAKQYNAILRRRQSRAKAESEKKLVKGRKFELVRSTSEQLLASSSRLNSPILISMSHDINMP
ncbi:nuclear transcription factor Y subunit A-7-like isoform X5 [Oryza brachyantha]|uniref:nuclear transcription factor Y subunit A-7-like isoform X5 n=1 Tax=Oryza brachyantha TaxID=4533 RepID=UPI001ADC92B3|nr:nuclear transcription factor Y subunit A-7-like isoform X5 [Oryza brachyantha]